MGHKRVTAQESDGTLSPGNARPDDGHHLAARRGPAHHERGVGTAAADRPPGSAEGVSRPSENARPGTPQTGPRDSCVPHTALRAPPFRSHLDRETKERVLLLGTPRRRARFATRRSLSSDAPAGQQHVGLAHMSGAGSDARPGEDSPAPRPIVLIIIVVRIDNSSSM